MAANTAISYSALWISRDAPRSVRTSLAVKLWELTPDAGARCCYRFSRLRNFPEKENDDCRALPFMLGPLQEHLVGDQPVTVQYRSRLHNLMS